MPASPQASPATDADDLPVHITTSVSSLRRIEMLLWGIFLLAAFTATYFAQVVLLPIVLGILVTLTLSPLVRGLARVGVPRVVSSVTIIMALGIGSALAVYATSGPVSTLMEQAPELGDRLRQKVSTLMVSVEQVKEASKQVEDIADGQPEPGVQKVVVSERTFLTRAVGSLLSAGTSLAVGLILAMFLLATFETFQLKMIMSLPRLSDKKRAFTIVRDIERQISRYLAAITVINAGLGVAVGTAMWAVGLDYPYLWGVAAFLLNYLPFIGAIIGAIGAGLIALLTFDSIGYALLAPLSYFTLTSIEGQVITPMLVGRRLELNVVAVLITVIFWTWFWGVPGALMAVPFLVLLKVVCDNVPALSVLGAFLGDSTESVHREASASGVA
ncbi:MAG: AI-2E family transporter [Tranquillimonas sp.]